MKAFVLSLGILTIVYGKVVSAEDLGNIREIAGDYYSGDGLGVNCSLMVSSQGKFSFQWDGCLGNYDKNKGSARVINGILYITPTKLNPHDGFRGTSTRFYPVPWGSRIYLIPTNEIVEFCSDINQGTEPRNDIHGSYYLRRGDEVKPVVGKPAIPGDWTKYLLEKPVCGRITSLIGKQEAWLNKGSTDGLLEGMILTAQQHGQTMFAQVQVEVVETNSCRIKCCWQSSTVETGQIVSSRFIP